MRKPTKKTTAIMIAAVTVLAGGGAAFAYWTAGGSGTGTASTSAATTGVTAVQTSTVTAMQPGDSAQTLAGNFTNPNSQPRLRDQRDRVHRQRHQGRRRCRRHRV